MTIKQMHTSDEFKNLLSRLKEKFEVGYDLTVEWIPRQNSIVAGEVKKSVILLYETDKKQALRTLVHEFLDFAISSIVEPYKEVANKVISLLNEKAYKRKSAEINSLASFHFDRN